MTRCQNLRTLTQAQAIIHPSAKQVSAVVKAYIFLFLYFLLHFIKYSFQGIRKYKILIQKIKHSLNDQNLLDLGDAGLEVLRGHLHLGPRGLDRLLDGGDVGVDLAARPDHAQGLDLNIIIFIQS